MKISRKELDLTLKSMKMRRYARNEAGEHPSAGAQDDDQTGVVDSEEASVG